MLWQLPTNDGTKSYQNLLVGVYGMQTSNRTNFDTEIQQKPFNFIRSGRYNYDIGNITFLTNDGYYWQAKTSSAVEVETLLFYATRISVQTSYPKGRGQPLRCLGR